MKLTATSVRSLALASDKREKTYFDDDLAGFGVRIREGGSKTFVIQYKFGNKHRRMVLGTVDGLDLGKARNTAKDLLARVRLGEDPAGMRIENRQKISTTFGALLPRYLAHQRSRLKPRSFGEITRHLEIYAKPLHARAVEDIDRRMIAVRLGEIAENSGPTSANRTRASLSAFFAWALREGIIETNPVVNTNKAVENEARARVISDDELRNIWRALGADQYGSIVKLLILTGTRRAEIGDLRWSEIDLDEATITLPPARTKNRREHQIALAPAALAILQAQPRRIEADGTPRDLVFGSGARGWQDWSGSKADLDARIAAASAPIPGWVLHDLRRAISTAMHERLGVMPHVVEAILGHSDHKAGVAGTYNRATYTEQTRVALSRWADHIDGLVTGKRSAAVVKLRRRV